jgi:hypothetical protein
MGYRAVFIYSLAFLAWAYVCFIELVVNGFNVLLGIFGGVIGFDLWSCRNTMATQNNRKERRIQNNSQGVGSSIVGNYHPCVTFGILYHSLLCFVFSAGQTNSQFRVPDPSTLLRNSDRSFLELGKKTQKAYSV